jgi:hypothetical protein
MRSRTEQNDFTNNANPLCTCQNLRHLSISWAFLRDDVVHDLSAMHNLTSLRAFIAQRNLPAVLPSNLRRLSIVIDVKIPENLDFILGSLTRLESLVLKV